MQKLSEKKLIHAQQDLMYRVSLVYFETLMARDQIDLLDAQKKAVNGQLLESKALYNAGLISITDVKEAETKSGVEINVVNVGIAGQHIKSLQHRGMIMRDSIEEEMKELLSRLFQCETPFTNSAGKSTFFNFTAQEINDKLG